jgi:hypothetical protein
MCGAHYYAVCLGEDNEWRLFDDHKVSLINGNLAEHGFGLKTSENIQ